MTTEQEIREWWDRNIENYLQNYARRNKLTIAQERENFFSETHEKFIKAIPCALKKLLDEKARE